MDLSANAGPGHLGAAQHLHRHQGHSTNMAESLRFQEEDIQSLMQDNLLDSSSENNNSSSNGGRGSSSFTALLGLPPNQAMEILHHEIAPVPPPPPPLPEQRLLDFPFRCSPTFPSNAALVERAARYSVFAAEGSPETSAVPSNSGNNSSAKVKSEPADSDSHPGSSFPADKPKRGAGKRKEPEKSKGKSGGKKNKGSGVEDGGGQENNNGSGGDKLPYVHVRARRGQATDSHSLAERARREKINARMKLLQELVPGCSKISGTALVLDEIINHVQSLQRQVEFLSMRLAAVNPRIDFGGLDSLLSAEDVRLGVGNGAAVGMEASLWPEVHVDGMRRQQPHQIWQVDLISSNQSSSLWEKDDDHHHQQNHGFISPGPSLLSYDNANPVPLHAHQLKTEL